MIITEHNHVLSSGHSLWFQWIPGHIGIRGNARAEAAARHAHDIEIITSVPLTVSACQLKTRRYYNTATKLLIQDTIRANAFLGYIDPTMSYTVRGQVSRR